MGAAFPAGLAYGLAVFGVGFLLGALRETLLAPRFGRDAVVMFEAPLILLAAWFIAGGLIRRARVGRGLPPRLAMGAIGLAVVLAGEAAIAVLGLGRTLSAHLAAYATTRGLLELLPQVVFALLPLLHRRRGRTA